MTATLTKIAHDDIVKLYDVERYGVVSRGNAIFVQHCVDRATVDALAVNEWAWIDFRSGMGKSTLRVTRIS